MGSNRQSPLWYRREQRLNSDYHPANTMKLDIEFHHDGNPYQNVFSNNNKTTKGPRRGHYLDSSLMDKRHHSFASVADVLPSCAAFLPPFLNLACKMSGGNPVTAKAPTSSTTGWCGRATSGRQRWWSQHRDNVAGAPRRTVPGNNRKCSSPPLVRRYRSAGFVFAEKSGLNSPDWNRDGITDSAGSDVPPVEKSWRSAAGKCVGGPNNQAADKRSSPRVVDNKEGSWRWPAVPASAATYADILRRANPVVGEDSSASVPTAAPISEPEQQQRSNPPCMIMTKFIKLVPTGAGGSGTVHENADTTKQQSPESSPKRAGSSKIKNGQCRLESLRELLSEAAETASSAGSVLRSRLGSFSSSPPPSAPSGQGCGPVMVTAVTCILGVPQLVAAKSCGDSSVAPIMGDSGDDSRSSDSGSSDSDDDDDNCNDNCNDSEPDDWDDGPEDCVDGIVFSFGADDAIGEEVPIAAVEILATAVAVTSIAPADNICIKSSTKCDTAPTPEEFRDFNEQLCLEQEESDDTIDDVNARWNAAYPDKLPESPSATRKVSFSNDGQPFAVHDVEYWCRKGEWEECARDRHRFQRRVQESASILAPIMGDEHRRRVYEERVAPSCPTYEIVASSPA